MNPRCPDCRRHDLACLAHADPLADDTVRCVDCQRRHATVGDRCDRCHHATLPAGRYTPAVSSPVILDEAVILEPTPRSMNDLPAGVLAAYRTARRQLRRVNTGTKPRHGERTKENA